MSLILAFLACLAYTTQARPSTNITGTSQVIDFMKRFGYLGNPNDNSEALFSEHAVVYGLMKLQAFAGLPQTGKIDQDTLNLLNTPRCGNPDVVVEKSRRKRFVLGSNGWEKRKLTYNLANWTPKLHNASFVQGELDRAFKMWADYSRLRFNRTESSDRADIVIYFGRYHHGDNYPFDGPGFVLAHAYYPYELGHYGGDIHFDEDEDWNPEAKFGGHGLDFFTVAVHEIGHALGLAHSSAYDSIMFPYYQGKSDAFALGYDDILAMYQLYISRPIEENDSSKETLNETDIEAAAVTVRYDTKKDNVTDDEMDVAGDYDFRTDVNETVPDDKHADDIPENDDNINVTSVTEETVTSTLTYDGHISGNNETTTLTYLGDMEAIEDHVKKMQKPDLCSGNFDTVASIRNELFIFKGQLMWRFQSRKYLRPGYPASFRQMFQGLPENVTKIDAVYERPDDNYILFFTGKQIWVYDGIRFYAPQSLPSLGLPDFVEKLDSVFVWGKNGKTYLFYQNLYWRFNEATKSIDEGYPQDISRWNGVPRNLDAVMTSSFDGKTYFFKGQEYWMYDDASVSASAPRKINQFWTSNCN